MQYFVLLWQQRLCTSPVSLTYLGQVANLRCAQVNSASYPSRDGKRVVAYELRGEGLVWLIGAVVCLRTAQVSFIQLSDNTVLQVSL